MFGFSIGPTFSDVLVGLPCVGVCRWVSVWVGWFCLLVSAFALLPSHVSIIGCNLFDRLHFVCNLFDRLRSVCNLFDRLRSV